MYQIKSSPRLVPSVSLPLCLIGPRHCCHAQAALPGTDPASLKLPVYGDKDWPVITYDCCLANETTFDEFYQRILTQHSINHNCDDISEIEGGRIVDMCEVGAGYPPKPSTKQDGIGTDGLTPRRSSHQHRPECCPVNL